MHMAMDFVWNDEEGNETIKLTCGNETLLKITRITMSCDNDNKRLVQLWESCGQKMTVTILRSDYVNVGDDRDCHISNRALSERIREFLHASTLPYQAAWIEKRAVISGWGPWEDSLLDVEDDLPVGSEGYLRFKEEIEFMRETIAMLLGSQKV